MIAYHQLVQEKFEITGARFAHYARSDDGLMLEKHEY
jgi:hypothetical protein